MKLLSPVNSFLSAKAQIEAGADEIYVGMKTNVFKNYSFSGRGQTSEEYETIVPVQIELCNIVELAHFNGATVSFTANNSCFAESPYPDLDLEKEYLDYIKAAIDCGVDNIIVGDIGLLYKLSQLRLPVNIHASTYFDTMSVNQLKMLKDMGVNRCILTYQIALEEIKRLCEVQIMEIEVFGFLGCSFFNGSCNFVHAMGEVACGEDIVIGVPCKAEYSVRGAGIDPQTLPFFDAELGCALCSLYSLKQIGVDVIKLAGRDRNYEVMAQVTKLFRNGIDLLDSVTKAEYLEKLDKKIYGWWKRLWCRKKRCKYLPNKITDSYIGLF